MSDSLDTLNAVHSVLQIARAGSFRGAMRATGIGFRTLNSRIAFLEEKLGFNILHRTPDGIVLTSEGQQVLEGAEQIEAIIARIQRLGKSFNHETEGEVMLATTEGMGTFWIAPQIKNFSKQHPKVAIRLHPSMSVANMRRFEIDLAIQVLEPVLPEIKRVRLARLHLMLAASPTYVAKHGNPAKISELKNHTFVFHSNPQFSDLSRIEHAVGSKLEQSQYLVLRNSSAHYMSIDSGVGIGFIPSYTFGIGTRLVPLAVPLHYELDVWLCFHEDGRSTPRIAKVIDWLNSIFDPRLYPWFRREFIAPKDFDAVIESNGVKQQILDLSLLR
jgi:DNA-binding transcriptional LysR family regulator